MWSNAPILNSCEKICHAIDMGISISMNGKSMPATHLAESFSDGRHASVIAERAVEYITSPVTFGGNKASLIYDKSDPSRDALAIIKISAAVLEYPLSVRCLTKCGVKFQLSEFMGKGRTCDIDDLIYSIDSYPYFVIVDITAYGKWNLFILESAELLRCVHNGTLKPSGWRKKSFYEHIAKFGYTLTKNAA
jgi:hypothetical protein